MKTHMCIAEIQHRRAAIENCVLAIQDWCASRRLQLNLDKTEMIWFGSRSNLARLHKDYLCQVVLGLGLDKLLKLFALVLCSCFICKVPLVSGCSGRYINWLIMIMNHNERGGATVATCCGHNLCAVSWTIYKEKEKKTGDKTAATAGDERDGSNLWGNVYERRGVKI